MVAEISKLELGREMAGGERSRRLGQEDLTTRPCIGDSGCAVDIDAYVVVAAEPPLTRVQPHADSHRRAVRPGV